jgi:hypothetical protein
MLIVAGAGSVNLFCLPNKMAGKEVVVRPLLLWFLGISIVVIVLPYLFYVVYQWQ